MNAKFRALEEPILPPLPEPLADAPQVDARQMDAGALADGVPQPLQPIPIPVRRSVRAGCWLANFSPVGAPLITFDGTIRVEAHSAGRTASGDLYQRRAVLVQWPLPSGGGGPVLMPAPNPANGIPILPINRYRYYLRITEILENATFGTSFRLGFEMWRYASPNTWTNEGAFSAQMAWITAPAGYPSASDYLEGDVRNAAGQVIGRLKMGWLSKYYRRASLEIDTVAGSERPLDNGAGLGWSKIFEALGWDVAIKLSDVDVAEASGAGWSDAEMHAAMLARRDAVQLDSDWRYHILAVKLIDSTPRGIMYDVQGTDSNHIPREGIGISTHWTIPNTSEWGLVRGMRFGTAAAPFFRTAVHEIGHAMGLFHTTVDNGFMNTTDVIAASATPANPFPNNIKWNYADVNLRQLRHYSDMFVRPGAVAFGAASMTTPPISPADLTIEAPDLELTVTPMLAEVPIGAPVRVDLKLVNHGTIAHRVPAKLSLKTDFVRGWVRGPFDAARGFSPVIRCIEDQPMVMLEPGGAITESLTLMRGADGALFPTSGLHEIIVEVSWDVGEVVAAVSGSTTVMVTGAQSPSHAAAAHKVLATPDAHLVLVLGGDHLSDGVEAVQNAVADEVLRPHFAVIEAKRLAQRTAGRTPRMEEAAALLDKNAVVSGPELVRMAKLAQAAPAKTKGIAAMTQAIKARASERELAPAVSDALGAL